MGAFAVAAVFAITGIGIGWLAGLSTSAVLGIVLTSIMATVAAVFAALPAAKSILKKPEGLSEIQSTDPAATAYAPAFLCVLVVGIGIGSGAGVWARTHFWFSPSDKEIIEHWKSLGLDGDMVTDRLFSVRLPTSAVSGPTISITPNDGGAPPVSLSPKRS
jgi:hypothetical protein